jgi:DNA-binding transcriptional LysR family regulator
MKTRRPDDQTWPVQALPDRKAIPPFASLRAFEAVGRLSGIRRAAAELGVDHAVVSRHLRALEAWIGLPLFDRSGSSPRLNATGREYHRVVSSAILTIARGTREILRSDGPSRVLIWCVPGFASRWLAPNLDHFIETHPGVEVELRPTDDSPDFASDEADGDIRFIRDIARFTPAAGVNCMNFARPSVFPVASPAWIAAHPAPQTARDILAMRLLHEENDEEWRGWFVANGVAVGARIPGPRLWHAHLTLDAARRGQGVALANPFLIARDIAEGRLALLAPFGPIRAGSEIGAYVFQTREDTAAAPAVRKFREWLALRAADFLAREENRGRPDSEAEATPGEPPRARRDPRAPGRRA